MRDRWDSQTESTGRKRGGVLRRAEYQDAEEEACEVQR